MPYLFNSDAQLIYLVREYLAWMLPFQRLFIWLLIFSSVYLFIEFHYFHLISALVILARKNSGNRKWDCLGMCKVRWIWKIIFLEYCLNDPYHTLRALLLSWKGTRWIPEAQGFIQAELFTVLDKLLKERWDLCSSRSSLYPELIWQQLFYIFTKIQGWKIKAAHVPYAEEKAVGKHEGDNSVGEHCIFRKPGSALPGMLWYGSAGEVVSSSVEIDK